MSWRNRVLLLVFLLAAALGVQLSAIERPYSGHFASYQATVMASIARNMVRENFSDLLRPKTDLMLTQAERSLHLNQYPFPAFMAAFGMQAFGGTLEFWGRFQAILANLLTALLLSLLAAYWFGSRVGWITATIYSLSPYTLIYGQSFLSEPLSLFFLVLALYLVVLPPSPFSSPPPRGRGEGEGDAPSRWGCLALSALCLSISVTGRIHFALFYPLFFLYLFLTAGKDRWTKLAGYFLLAVAVPFAWYTYTYRFSLQVENVHTNIFVQAEFFKGRLTDLLDPNYWREVFDILSQRMLTPLLFPFLLLGAYVMPKRASPFWLLWGGLLAGGLLIVLAPPKVMKHDFYIYGLFPFVAWTTAFGVDRVLTASSLMKRRAAIGLALILYFAISARYFVNPIFKITATERQAVLVAERVRRMTQPEDLLVVASKEPPLLVYYADRPSWNMDLTQVGRPVVGYLKSRFRKFDPGELERLEQAAQDPVTWLEYLRSKGARYLVTLTRGELEEIPDFLGHLKQNYQIISAEEDDFYLFHLIPNDT